MFTKSGIRIGIVGTGWMASERLCVFNSMPGVEVTGVCSRDLSKARSLVDPIGAIAYDSYGRLLAESDAVVLCVPNDLHVSMALEGLSAGKHVLVEYPLATSMEDADSLRLAAQECGCALMVGNTIIHEAMFGYLQKNKERLGDIVSAASRVAWYSEDLADHWYMRSQRRGPIFASFHYHHIEYYRRFLGEVEWVLGRSESMAKEGVPDQASLVGGTLLLGHVNARTSCIQWYLGSDGNGLPRGLWMNGTDSSVAIISVGPSRSQVIWDDGGDGKMEEYDDDWGVSGSCADFIEAVEGRLDYTARLASDIETLRVGLLASQSDKHPELRYVR